MILGNALEIRNFFFALGLIACHHILKAQVIALGRGLGLPHAGCSVPGRAAPALTRGPSAAAGIAEMAALAGAVLARAAGPGPSHCAADGVPAAAAA